MDKVTRLLAGLMKADPSFSARDAAEVFWLASHMRGFRQASGPVPSPVDPVRPGSRDSKRKPDTGSSERDDVLPGEDLPVWYPRHGRTEAPPTGVDALPVRLPDTRELPRPLDLQRGLRPLLRTVNIGPDLLLDEETTVRDSADAHVVVPALVKSPEQWLDLALVIDTGPSMILWDKLIAEFRRMLTCLGAFRAIRTWYLRSDGKGIAISPGSPAGSPRAVKELVDPSGRQAILVVTDCVGEPWHTGEAMKALGVWACTGPLAIVQPLGQRLWARSAVTCHNVQLLAPFPGAPNRRLIVDPGRRPRADRKHADLPAPRRPAVGRSGSQWQSEPQWQLEAAFGAGHAPAHGPRADRSRAGVVVPILEMTPRWLGQWARLVSGTSPVYGVAAFTGAPPRQNKDGAGLLPDHDPNQVVERFVAAASPEAVRLAGLLAAAPLHLPLMRLIQHEMLPEPRPMQLAEVYLGGLLRSVSAFGPDYKARHDTFDFLEGVRDVLLGTILKSEARKVMDLVSEQRGRSYGSAEAGHTAWVEVPGGTAGGRQMTTADAFYGTIKTGVLLRMGLTDVWTPETVGAGIAGGADIWELIPDAATDDTLVPDAATGATLVPAGATEVDLGPVHALPADLRPKSSPEAVQATPSGQKAPDSLVTAGRLEHGITLLGTSSSGKTTLLGALGPALTQRGDQWRLVPTDDPSAQLLITMITHLTSNQVFPSASDREIARHSWQLWGRNSQARWRWFRRPELVRFDLNVVDPSGEIFMTDEEREEQLIDTLVNSRGILLMFDPIREFERGDAFEYVFKVVTRLAQRMIGPNASEDGRLPHYVSVCVSKFDDRRVFEAAGALGLATVLDDDPYGFPRVTDPDAREFFSELCRVSKSGTARMAMDLVERFFRSDRIRYFVTSAIGFYIDRRIGVFSSGDYVNTLPGEPKRIRGAIHPINVAEPIIWLGGRLAAESSDQQEPRR